MYTQGDCTLSKSHGRIQQNFIKLRNSRTNPIPISLRTLQFYKTYQAPRRSSFTFSLNNFPFIFTPRLKEIITHAIECCHIYIRSTAYARVMLTSIKIMLMKRRERRRNELKTISERICNGGRCQGAIIVITLRIISRERFGVTASDENQISGWV